MRVVIFTSPGALPHAVRQVLHERACEVVEAASSTDLPGLTRRLLPDVIIVRAAPLPAALALARALRDGGASAALLLIVADCRGDVALEAMRAGVNDVLGERCSAADAAASLARVLGGA